MIFGKYINRYYLKYAWILLVGLAALVLVDYFQLEVPELYRMVVNGINTGVVETAEGTVPFDLDFLLDRIWGYEFYGETRTVDVHIRHIRQKLGDDAHYIETIRGVGYKFNDRQDNRL